MGTGRAIRYGGISLLRFDGRRLQSRLPGRP